MTERQDFGKFYGSDLSPQLCDFIALNGIKNDLLEKEASLFATKWFDYRFLHPTKATYLFAHLYSEGYKLASQQIYDVNKGKYMKGWKGKDFMDKKERGGFWKARQKADELGIPYSNYINYAIQFGLKRCWKRIPRPTHLYSDLCVEFVYDRWQEELLAGIVEPQIAHLRLENQKDSIVHTAMQRWVCSVLKTRKNPHFGLSHYMSKLKIVSESIALEYFDIETLTKAHKEAEYY